MAEACQRLGHVVFEADIAPGRLEAIFVPADIVFPVLHGKFGEDGELQTLLESHGVSFVGSGAAASRIGMDKSACKTRWKSLGLPTPDWRCVDSSIPLDAVNSIEPPFVIKPNSEGSSIGIRLVDTLPDLEKLLVERLSEHEQILVEHRLKGSDVTVGILAGEPLPVLRIVPATDFLNYDAKYSRGDTQYYFDSESVSPYVREAKDLAMQAFESIGARDYGRVDFILDLDRGLQILEINTIPGFTSTSFLPKAAAQAGYSFDELVGVLVELAASRMPNH